jgi:hypothetical protein
MPSPRAWASRVFWCDCGKSLHLISRFSRHRSDYAPGDLGAVNTIRDLNTRREQTRRGCSPNFPAHLNDL